ncbi:LysR substrate-binding domain-containing protein [Pseudooceanicola onchidii]|uniref:LysR substrate-binding domain-containing protein n=1 Tax=Pseudooceanicola onchidii TaxID=2562279 RepID=UPI0010AAB6D4|nr:LysR substrate-binding domain-containing protein [Pseudooceanicola onchidii]
MEDLDWRHLPSLSALRAFEATARLDGFSAAARALNVTPAAVAQQVRGLEAELEVTLVTRQGRGLALTPEGTRLATALGEGFSRIAGAVEDLRRPARVRGIRVTATVALSQTVLMPRLPRFWARHPDIPVSLNPTQSVVGLGRNGADLAIRTGTGPWPDTQSTFLFRTQMVVVGAPALLAGGASLADLPWIVDEGYPSEAEWLELGGLDIRKVKIQSMDNPILSVSAAEAGLGLIFATDRVVADSIAQGKLVEVDYPPLPVAQYWMVTPEGPLRAEVRAFMDWLMAEVGPAEA